MGKINAAEKRLLIILLGILIFVACYFFGFQKLWEEADSIEIANSNLSSKLSELQSKVNRQEEYEENTAKLQESLRLFFIDYPVYMQVEDGVMDVVGFESDTDTFVSALTYGESTTVEVGEPTVVTVPVETEEGEDGLDETAVETQIVHTGAASRYTLYETPVDIVFETTYAGAKRLILNIVGDSDKKSVTRLLLTFDTSTGILSGTATYANWFISGQDKEYKGADIPNVPTGVSNIFGTVEKKAKEPAGDDE